MPETLYPPGAVLLAPLAGYTDLAFRRACRHYGCRYAFTPLIEAGSIVYGTERTQKSMIRGTNEPWLGIQLLGASPDLLRKAACRIRNLPFDVADFNMGCPVRKVTKRGAGAAMCETPDLAARCLETLATELKCPVTAKIRVLDETNASATVFLARRLFEAGAAAITIHGRIVDRVYSGPVAAGVIAAVRRDLPIPIIANGGAKDCATAAELKESTGCSRIMVARGAIGNPWIFRALEAGRDLPPTHEEVCNTLRKHVEGIVELYGESAGMRYSRKIIAAYLCGRGYRRALRARTTSVSSLAEFEELMQEVEQNAPA